MVFVVVITLIDRTLNDGLQQKTRRYRWISSFFILWKRQNSGTVRVGALLHITSWSQASGDFDKPTSFQSEMNDDHLYRDPEYSWDDYI